MMLVPGAAAAAAAAAASRMLAGVVVIIMAAGGGMTTVSAASAPAFSLDVAGPDWDYTGAEHLAAGTSGGCRQAYAAQIACPDTLLGLTTMLRPDVTPASADLDALCRPACRHALDDYVGNVRAACQAPADAARMRSRADPPYRYFDVPVEVVGLVLQYVQANACSKDGDGSYCQLSESSVGSDATFSCENDPCAAAFFRNGHDLPGSQFHFNHGLLPATTWWQDQFEAGFDHLVSCGLAEPKPASTLTGITTTTVTTTATGSAVVFSSSSLVTGTGADKASAETISAAAAEASASITAVTTPAAAHRSSPLLWGCVSTLFALSIMLAMLALV